jgi:hypothetical protein
MLRSLLRPESGFTGYFGVSARGFDRIGAQYPGQAGRFLQSIDPEYAISRITPPASMGSSCHAGYRHPLR